MKLMHPYVIDTSVIFNLTGDRNRKSKLQLLAKHFLQEEIQVNKAGHSSIEDSTACLKLTKLKLSKDIYFGDLALESKRSIFENKTIIHSGIARNADANASSNVKTPIFSHALKRQKRSVIITTQNSNVDLNKMHSHSKFSILQDKCSDDADNDVKEEQSHGIKHHKEVSVKRVIKKTREILMDNDFNLLHFNIFDDLIDEGVDDNDEDDGDDAKMAKMVPKIDKWIQKIWSRVASNGLFVVIFGGKGSNSNGLSMIQVKS